MNRRGFLKSVVGASATLVAPKMPFASFFSPPPRLAASGMAAALAATMVETKAVCAARVLNANFAALLRPGVTRVFDDAYANLPDA